VDRRWRRANLQGMFLTQLKRSGTDMKKNVAGQKIGAQMVTAADGSEYQGTVNCYVTLDGGTQALGTVGAGVCAHEGHGYHTYGPSQAETNGDLNAYTFVASAANVAVPATIQCYTDFPQSADVGALTANGAVLANVIQIDSVANEAVRLRRGLAGVTLGVCAAGGNVTNIIPSTLDPAATTADQFKGKVINFERNTTTVALRGQGSNITNSAANGVLTIVALTTAPVSGDTFTIA